MQITNMILEIGEEFIEIPITTEKSNEIKKEINKEEKKW